MSNQLYVKVTPLETFVWEGKKPEDISAAFKNVTLDLGLQLPILKGTAAWFGIGSHRHLPAVGHSTASISVQSVV